jgi:hypothetical protein
VEGADASSRFKSGTGIMAGRRTLAEAGAAAVAVLMLAACQGSSGPSPSSVASPTLTRATTPFTADERALYREAVRRVESFDAANQPILAAGRATREAKELYQRRLWKWRAAFAELRRSEREGIRVARAPVVLSTEAASVKDFPDSAAEIILRRCTDRSDLGVTQHGTPVPAEHDEPVIQEVVVSRSENGTWRIDSSTVTDEACSG